MHQIGYKELLHSLQICDVDGICRDLQKILDFPTLYAPADFFDYVGHGSWKEVFSIDANYVLKFCSINNETLKEIETLEIARQHGLENIFAESYYIPIGNDIELIRPVRYYDENDSERRIFNYLLIQRTAVPSGYIEKNWMQSVVDTYGANYVRKLNEFIEKYHICDLSKWNIGYIDNKPVIFDWLI